MPLDLTRSRVSCALLLSAIAALAASTPAAAAPNNKPYSVSFSETTAAAGVTTDAFRVTITNTSRTQPTQLGSANVTLPADFTVAPSLAAPAPQTPAIDRGSITNAGGGKLELRQLALSPGQSATVTLRLRRTCVAGTYFWQVSAKQSNDYSGVGNDLTAPDRSTLSNTVDGTCKLRFARQPTAAAKAEQIRGTAYAGSTSTDLVSVEAVDGRASGAQRLDWFTGTVGMVRGATAYSGQLTATPVAAQAGLAAFSNLSISLAGTYTIRPTTTSEGFATAADSGSFPITDVVADCSKGPCTAELGSGALKATKITSTATTGFLTLSQNVGPDPSCAGYTPPVRNVWYEFELNANAEKTIVLNYNRDQMRSVKGGASALEVCFATPGPSSGVPAFRIKGGGLAAPFDYDGPGPLTDGWTGLLPNCTTPRTAPCVTSRDSLGGGAASITFVAPGSLGDPRYH